MPYFFVLFGAFMTFFGIDSANTGGQEGHLYVVALQILAFICFVCATCFVVYDLHLDATFASETQIFHQYLKESEEAADKEDFERCAMLAEAYDKFAISRGRMF